MKGIGRRWWAVTGAAVLLASPASAESLIRRGPEGLASPWAIASAMRASGTDVRPGPVVATAPEGFPAEVGWAWMASGLPHGPGPLGADASGVPDAAWALRPAVPDLGGTSGPEGVGPDSGLLKVLARKVPEPTSMGLLGIGLSGLITLRRVLRRLRLA